MTLYYNEAAEGLVGLSVPGEVLVSETVRSLARTSGGVSPGRQIENSVAVEPRLRTLPGT